MTPKAMNVEILENYELKITFENGEVKIFDVKPYFGHKIFDELKDEKLFKTVKIAGLSIEWENGADICPDELYNLSKAI
jgi:hypothetical protein